MKVQRWDPPRSFPTKALAWIPCDDGDWCRTDDVDVLESANAELLQTLYKCGQLLEILHTEDVEINKLINEHYNLVRDVVVKFGGEDLNSMD